MRIRGRQHKQEDKIIQFCRGLLTRSTQKKKLVPSPLDGSSYQKNKKKLHFHLRISNILSTYIFV